MAEGTDDIREVAIEWLIRLRGGTAEDWKLFVEWLEADPMHAEAFDEVAAADALIDGLPRRLPRTIQKPNEAPQAARLVRRRTVLGWGVAAVVAGSLGFWSLYPDRELYSIETAPGESRSINLADGSRIALNGATRLELDRGDARFVQLAEGEAFFQVSPDPSHPFKVAAGDTEVRVVGTAFNVVRTSSTIEVAIAEGTILFDADRERVRLDAGTMLQRTDGRIAVVQANPRDVGSWRDARLSYASAPISRIAADLSRTAGIRIEASPEVANRRIQRRHRRRA